MSIDKWAFPCSTPGPFVNKTISKVIPHTDEVVVCSKCHSSFIPPSSLGSGKEVCPECNGNGKRSTFITLPSGKEEQLISHRCLRCEGTGFLLCSRCLGYGQTVMYKTVWLDWNIHCRCAFTTSACAATRSHSPPREP